MIGISACLGGIYCRYDGQTNEIAPLRKMVEDGQAVLICPEVLGGLPTPRVPAEIIGGDGVRVWQNQARVVSNSGQDVTEQFKQGAILAYKRLKNAKVTTLILKEKSPSCGSQRIYDGSFSGVKIKGVGVATAYFLSQGLTVYSEENWQDALKE